MPIHRVAASTYAIVTQTGESNGSGANTANLTVGASTPPHFADWWFVEPEPRIFEGGEAGEPAPPEATIPRIVSQYGSYI